MTAKPQVNIVPTASSQSGRSSGLAIIPKSHPVPRLREPGRWDEEPGRSPVVDLDDDPLWPDERNQDHEDRRQC
jgi:hypothetical protein